MPTLLPKRKATRARAPARAPGRSGVVRDPGMHARSWHGNREISRPTTGPRAVWSASGRRGAVADDARTGEVRPRQRSGEAGEQGRATVRGVGGAKGGGRGERGPGPHPPGSGPGKRVTGAGPRTARCTAKKEGTVHRAPPPGPPHPARKGLLALRRQAAPGVDGLTWQAYEADLDRRIEGLHERVHRGAYRALPARRGFIPKADGSQRPLAIAALEDKIVQRATAAVLNAIYEEDFLGFSYGFRPGRGAHDALDALAVGITSTKVSHILDADIRSFFDAVSQEWLLRFVNHRIGDPRILRLIRTWLNAGVLEDGVVSVGETGTGQGSGISPLLANVYLHDVFDLWAERWRRREARGDMMIVRYADDVRHITRRWIPFAKRRGLEDMTPGPTA